MMRPNTFCQMQLRFVLEKQSVCTFELHFSFTGRVVVEPIYKGVNMLVACYVRSTFCFTKPSFTSIFFPGSCHGGLGELVVRVYVGPIRTNWYRICSALSASCNSGVHVGSQSKCFLGTVPYTCIYPVGTCRC